MVAGLGVPIFRVFTVNMFAKENGYTFRGSNSAILIFASLNLCQLVKDKFLSGGAMVLGKPPLPGRPTYFGLE